VRADFNGPVSQVAGEQIHNQFVHSGPPAPSPDTAGQATRECPQCRSLTWAYNARCHHCQLDMRAFDRRSWWSTRLSKRGVVLAAALFMLAGVLMLAARQAHAQEIEIVRIKPGEKPKQPTAQEIAFAKRLRSDLQRLDNDASITLPNDVKSRERLRLLGAMRDEAERRLELWGPLRSCRLAASWAANEYGERRGFSFAMTKRDPGVLVVASRGFAENMTSCRADIEAAETAPKK
jgi:hypothetical protein